MKYNEIIARIIWTRQDIRQLLEDNGIDSTEEAVDHFLERLDHLQLKYRRAFMRCDHDRYQDFMAQVRTGGASLHTGTLMPYQIVAAAYRAREDDREALDVTWSALEDFTRDENAIVVADGSGSMYWGGDRYRVIRAG